MKIKKLKAGFGLCITGACILLMWLCYLLLASFAADLTFLPYTVPVLGYALIVIFLAVFAKKGSRAEAIGILILSCIVPAFVFLTWLRLMEQNGETMAMEMIVYLLSTVFTLIGSCVMLGAIPKASLSVSEPSEAEISEEESAVRPEAAQGESQAEELHETKTVKKRNGAGARVARLFRAAAQKITGFREKFVKESAPKRRAFVILTVIFAALSCFLILCYILGFFQQNPRILPWYFQSFFDSSLTEKPYYYSAEMGGLWSFIQCLTPTNYCPFYRSQIGTVILLVLMSMLPTYFVYLGTHNPLRLPRGYTFACYTFAATLFLLSDIRMIELIRPYLLFVQRNEQLVFWSWILIVSAIAAQILSFFFFRIFVKENTSVGAATVFALIGELLLPFIAALIILILLALAMLAAAAFCVYLTLCAVMLFLRNSNDSFIKGLRGDPVKVKEYTFTTDMGTTMTVYSQDGKTFYTDNGTYVGHSEDGGRTIIRD